MCNHQSHLRLRLLRLGLWVLLVRRLHLVRPFLTVRVRLVLHLDLRFHYLRLFRRVRVHLVLHLHRVIRFHLLFHYRQPFLMDPLFPMDRVLLVPHLVRGRH